MTPQGFAIPSRMGSARETAGAFPKGSGNGNIERFPKPVALAEVRKDYA